MAQNRAHGTVFVDNLRHISLDVYARMHLIRRIEEVLIGEYHPANEMRCPIHFCLGQEVVPACLGELIGSEDTLISHYRSHGYYLAKGGHLDAMVAEFYGKATGANSGLAGSMELASPGDRFHSGAIVGAPLPLAIGAAFASAYNREKSIAVAVFGDGAMDAGVSYEALNIASLWKLPILMICENNGYAAHAPIATRQAGAGLRARVSAFGVRTMIVDGNDPVETLRCLGEAYDSVADGEGPVFVEATTYRTCAHVGPTSDDWLDYRPRDELEQWSSNDPVLKTRELLLKDPNAASLLANAEERNEAMIAEAVRAAKVAPFMELSNVREMMWAGTYHNAGIPIRERESALFLPDQVEAVLGPY
jgi:TPP-dependent pyruvate/acetoin dehydrogenase alpha subunit